MLYFLPCSQAYKSSPNAETSVAVIAILKFVFEPKIMKFKQHFVDSRSLSLQTAVSKFSYSHSFNFLQGGGGGGR